MKQNIYDDEDFFEKYDELRFTEIINELIKSGLSIDKIEEPIASKEAIAKNPKYINQLDRPFFLIIRAKKIV